MKTENTVLYVLRLAVTLFVITAVVAAALAGVNSITKPVIDKLNAEKTQQAIAAVLPGVYDEEITDYADATGLVSKVYKGANGYALEVKPSGFDNIITMMVGIDFEGKILGISVVSHTETAGLGAVADAETPAGVSFREQFIGMNGTVSMLKERGAQAGIEQFVILPVAVAPARTRHINDFILEQVAKESRFLGFGTLHAAMDGITDEVQYIMDKGLRGVNMHPDSQVFAIDDERLFPAYEMLEGKLPVILHMGDKRYDYSHPARLRHVLESFPNLQVKNMLLR